MLPLRSLLLLMVGGLACTGDTPSDSGGQHGDSADDGTRPWRRTLPPLSGEVQGPRGYTLERAIVHLHSSWSHDACDGEPFDADGHPRRDCLAQLREGLCDAGIDHAFLSDHPSWFATATWDTDPVAGVFQPDDGDTLLPSNDAPRVMTWACPDGHVVHWYPGVEDELMPVALDHHVDGDAKQRDTTYNQTDGEALSAFEKAGAVRLLAHTEGRDVPTLETLVGEGLQGVEVFNLHAMFAPDIRSEDLGLDPSSWLADMAPFTADHSLLEPDLFVLVVLQAQPPSEAAWDDLQQVAPDDRIVVGTAGTDAHQNVLPMEMVDGERVDSYRRMLRWFSQYLWMDSDDIDSAEQTLAAGRFHVAFEVLGTPQDFDFHLEGADGAIYEMGSALTDAVLPATLVVGCTHLSAESPEGPEAPEITTTLYKDGQPWQDGCGSFAVDTPGVFRARVDMTPWHLSPFLGDDADVLSSLIHPYPWVYGNPIRVRAATP